jgi:hypothetical protein
VGEGGVGGELGLQRAGLELLLERCPGLARAERRRVETDQLSDRPGGVAVLGAGHEEVRAGERVGPGRVGEIERVAAIALGRIVGRAGRGGARRGRGARTRRGRDQARRCGATAEDGADQAR